MMMAPPDIVPSMGFVVPVSTPTFIVFALVQLTDLATLVSVPLMPTNMFDASHPALATALVATGYAADTLLRVVPLPTCNVSALLAARASHTPDDASEPAPAPSNVRSTPESVMFATEQKNPALPGVIVLVKLSELTKSHAYTPPDSRKTGRFAAVDCVRCAPGSSRTETLKVVLTFLSPQNAVMVSFVDSVVMTAS